MCKKRMKRVLSICRAHFMRKHTRRKSVERAELSCRTCFGKMDGLLSPREWIDIARGAGVRAIAITDFQGVEGFKEAAQAVEKLRKEAGPGAVDFKMLYGLETVLEDGCPVHLLVRRQEGLAQLYRLLEIAWQGREERPFLHKAEVSEHRTGLLVGCPGEGGEVCRGILDNLDDTRLEEIAGFYDYLSVLPPQHYGLLSTREHALCGEALSAEDLILKTIAIGKRSGRPVAAAGNVRTASQDWGIFRSSTAYDILKDEDLILDPIVLSRRLGQPVAATENTRTENQPWGMFRCGAAYYVLKGEDLDMPLPNHLYTEKNGAWDVSLPDLLCTEEMLDAFSFLGKELAEKIVIHAPNRLADQCSEIRIFPEDVRCLQPILPNAFQSVSELCREQLQTRYGGTIPETVRERVEYELAMLQNNELLCSAFLISRHLVQGLQEKGYSIQTIAHNCSFFHAYTCIPYLLGVTTETVHTVSQDWCEGDGVPLELILRVPEECWKDVIEIFSQMFPQSMAVSCRNWDGRIFVPDAAELRSWMPLQKTDNGYQIPYGRVEDFSDLFQVFLCPPKSDSDEGFSNLFQFLLYCI